MTGVWAGFIAKYVKNTKKGCNSLKMEELYEPNDFQMYQDDKKYKNGFFGK